MWSFFFNGVWCKVTQCVSKTMYLGSSPSALAKKKGVVMVKKFNLVQNADKLKNEMVVSLLQGETIDLTFKGMEFSYSKANVRLNNIFVGTTTNGQIGIHSSKIKNGYNELSVDFLNAENEIIKSFSYVFVATPNAKDDKTLAEEFASLYTDFELLKNEVQKLQNWKQEIDNERSGF